MLSFCILMRTLLVPQQYFICVIDEIIELYVTNVICRANANKDTGKSLYRVS